MGSYNPTAKKIEDLNNMLKYTGLMCLPLILIATLLSSHPHIHYDIFNLINHALPSQALWMTITNLGDVLFISCVLFIFLHKRPHLLTNALLGGVLLHYSVKYSKLFFSVLRPEHNPELPSLIKLGTTISLDNYAMPSGHTASAFMAAIFIARAYSLSGFKLVGIWCYAILVGVSRIAVGAHWPADIFAGAALGMMLGLIFTHPGFAIKHRSLIYINTVLCIPLIELSVYRARNIHNPLSLLNESVIVIAGLTALAFLCIEIKKIFCSAKLPASKES